MTDRKGVLAELQVLVQCCFNQCAVSDSVARLKVTPCRRSWFTMLQHRSIQTHARGRTQAYTLTHRRKGVVNQCLESDPNLHPQLWALKSRLKRYLLKCYKLFPLTDWLCSLPRTSWREEHILSRLHIGYWHIWFTPIIIWNSQRHWTDSSQQNNEQRHRPDPANNNNQPKDTELKTTKKTTNKKRHWTDSRQQKMNSQRHRTDPRQQNNEQPKTLN